MKIQTVGLALAEEYMSKSCIEYTVCGYLSVNSVSLTELLKSTAWL